MMFLFISIVLLLEMPADVLGLTLNSVSKVLVRAEGKTIFLPCNATGLGSSDYIHWYQVKDGQAPSRLLYISQGGSVAYDTNIKEAKDFTVDKKKLYDLKLSNTQTSHSAVYFCAYWDTSSGDKKVFGSGTRLYVTGPGNTVESPKVSGYLPSKKYSDKHGKQTMLCHASGTVPYLVKFTWAKKSETEEWTAVPKEDVVEQSYKDKKIVTSMMIVDKNTAENNSYQCTVTIDGITENPQILEMKREDIKTAKGPSPTCPPDSEETMQISGDSEQISSLYVFVYAYGVMIMKNGLYFCVVSIFLLKRKAGRKKDESS
uniref:T-cell receptor gamma, type unspecified n=1 Tax=Cyprinus carpio carpio TaxID=630221 RepID=A0A9J8CUM2_CYPCA